VGTAPLLKVTVRLAQNHLSLIIGKKGSKLNEIKSIGKAWIDIPRDRQEFTEVTIEGVERYVLRTLKMIEETIGISLDVQGVSQVMAIQIKPIDLRQGDINEALFFSGFPENESKNNETFKRFLRYLHSATETLDVCVFTITDDEISREILDRHRSGVHVRVITDDDQSKSLGSDIHNFIEAGIEVKMDDSPAHMHHKFAVIDHVCVINGSFNWTRQARQDNSENTVISNNSSLAESFQTHFEYLWSKFS